MLNPLKTAELSNILGSEGINHMQWLANFQDLILLSMSEMLLAGVFHKDLTHPEPCKMGLTYALNSSLSFIYVNFFSFNKGKPCNIL